MIVCRVISVLALIYYLRCASTNPGYLIGSAADVASKSGAYDPKLYAIDNMNNDVTNVTVELSAMENDFGPDGDLSILGDNNDVSPTGNGTKHNKNPSFLTKDFNLSRHERRKSTIDSEPCLTDNSAAGSNDIISIGLYSSNQFDKNDQGALKLHASNTSADNKNRRRIKPVLPGDYNSKSSSPLGTLEDITGERNSAYDTI